MICLNCQTIFRFLCFLTTNTMRWAKRIPFQWKETMLKPSVSSDLHAHKQYNLREYFLLRWRKLNQNFQPLGRWKGYTHEWPTCFRGEMAFNRVWIPNHLFQFFNRIFEFRDHFSFDNFSEKFEYHLQKTYHYIFSSSLPVFVMMQRKTSWHKDLKVLTQKLKINQSYWFPK